ncbi:MAG: flagellar motor switch protein FliM [Deltaproteobacteria bacterium]|jgi:flagellar motor switch protein FliM|nr:flagellar motor switch protein FliM [Deltaproteobacteria bacterium]
MSNQILTQAEIDALLSAMERGDVDLQQGPKQEVEAAPYNLMSQNIVLRNQFSALEKVYDNFIRIVQHTLLSVMQRNITIEFVSTEMVKYQEFISAFSSPTSFNLFVAKPLVGNAILAIESNLVFSLIDCMFGGEGRPSSQVRDFTQIEQRMIQKFAIELLARFEESWSTVCPLKIELKKTETKPEFVQLVPPGDVMLIVVFALQAPEFSGNFHLALPYRMLEPIKEKLSPMYLRDKDLQHTWRPQLKELLKDTCVTIIAELGRTQQTVRELINLQVEDVIQLKAGPEDLISISVDQVPKYLGYPGIIKGNRAVEIAKLINSNGGNS